MVYRIQNGYNELFFMLHYTTCDCTEVEGWQTLRQYQQGIVDTHSAHA